MACEWNYERQYPSYCQQRDLSRNHDRRACQNEEKEVNWSCKINNDFSVFNSTILLFPKRPLQISRGVFLYVRKYRYEQVHC